MIAYEDLVASLNSWRARQGLPTTPPDYGEPVPVAYADADVLEESAPQEVYDLSDDSGLIMTEDIVQAPEMGVIDTGVEMSQTADEAVASEYDDPPATEDYGSFADSGEEIPDVTANDVEALPDEVPIADDVDVDMASTEAYDEPYDDAPVETVDVDDAGVIEEQALDETLEAEADDVVGEEAVDDSAPLYDDSEAMEPPPLDDAPEDVDVAGIIDDEPLPAYEDEEDLEGETVVAADPGDSDEPEALPDVPGPDDEPLPE